MIGIFSFFNLIRKPPMKDWIIIFLLKSYISTFLDNLAVKNGYIKYPLKLFKSFDISVIFSYLLFPVSCIYYNQLTDHFKIIGTFFITFAFALPMALFENILEKKTRLIKYQKSWGFPHSFGSLFITFITVRAIYKLISFVSRKQNESAGS
ncbi:hypothetical protein WQ54_06770 [Bacillus sp. SA1-12]|uniref:CBO0543 family protein n=1 Tax=Bacillus sp. SA1-12 TaxID=1455638 RepID=UPI000626E25E|nr:CBO0543 family protein [Bacillus sp. SA1-12]KKI92881.1 hypothetical protein WQ54_06770 [Bacillus sp. SA1-12]